MPITLYTASLCGLLFMLLSWRAARYRRLHAIPFGDGVDLRMISLMRAQLNFSEYVPLCLLLMALIEARLGPVWPLWIAGAVLFASRIAHAVGMDTLKPGGWRDVGIAGTWAVLVALSLTGMALTLWR